MFKKSKDNSIVWIIFSSIGFLFLLYLSIITTNEGRVICLIGSLCYLVGIIYEIYDYRKLTLTKP